MTADAIHQLVIAHEPQRRCFCGRRIGYEAERCRRCGERNLYRFKDQDAYGLAQIIESEPEPDPRRNVPEEVREKLRAAQKGKSKAPAAVAKARATAEARKRGRVSEDAHTFAELSIGRVFQLTHENHASGDWQKITITRARHRQTGCTYPLPGVRLVLPSGEAPTLSLRFQDLAREAHFRLASDPAAGVYVKLGKATARHREAGEVRTLTATRRVLAEATGETP